MRSKHQNKSKIRSFEREERIRRLLEAGLIAEASDIPADAIPSTVSFAQDCRSSLHNFHRKPYFRDVEFTCKDCGAPDVWFAEEQRHWHEALRRSPYTTAARCRRCRLLKHGLPERSNRKK